MSEPNVSLLAWVGVMFQGRGSWGLIYIGVEDPFQGTQTDEKKIKNIIVGFPDKYPISSRSTLVTSDFLSVCPTFSRLARSSLGLSDLFDPNYDSHDL